MTDPTVEAWTRANAEYTDERAEQSWAADEITWGIWNVPESELHALPDVAGKEVVELGCGTAYFGAWLKKVGAARVVTAIAPRNVPTVQMPRSASATPRIAAPLSGRKKSA